jgi:hypothetical protein
MTEIPVLRLGLAGFSAEQQQTVADVLREGAGESAAWEAGDLEGADGWWINGARTQTLEDDRIRIASGGSNGRSLQLHLPDVGRPVAFARPLPRDFHALCSFDLSSRSSIQAVLRKFETWLTPVGAQFRLAAHIAEHQSALGRGVFDLSIGGTLVALVDMQGEAAVKTTAGPADFEGAVWGRRNGPFTVPEHFVRTSLSQLMWQYAMRTQLDLLPKHYRTAPVYFRRAPRVPQRMLKDAHLLLMRELFGGPATLSDLALRCEMPELQLARNLAALYLVGSITSNPRRASTPSRPPEEADSGPSGGEALLLAPQPTRPPAGEDRTAPAPLGPS